MYQVTHDVLHVIFTRLLAGHLRVHVGDSSRRSEEIVQTSGIAALNAIVIIIIIIVKEEKFATVLWICRI